jgi:pre-mRNA-splicing factor CDC5/CEF1
LIRQARAAKLGSQIQDTFKQMNTAATELECFQELQKQEQMAGAYRVRNLAEEVNKQKALERTLQSRYGDLLSGHQRIQEQLAEYKKQLKLQEAAMEAERRAKEEAVEAEKRAEEESVEAEKCAKEEAVEAEKRAKEEAVEVEKRAEEEAVEADKHAKEEEAAAQNHAAEEENEKKKSKC